MQVLTILAQKMLEHAGLLLSLAALFAALVK